MCAELRRRLLQVVAVVVLPVLLLLIFGMVEMAAAWRTFQLITNIARDGARVAVLPSSTDQDVTDHIESLLDGSGLDSGEAGIAYACEAEGSSSICANTNNATRVTVDYPYTFRLLGPLVAFAGGNGDGFGTISIASTSIMRRE